jgi:hypothetical protein
MTIRSTDDLVTHYREARARGERHLAQLYRARYGLSTGDFDGPFRDAGDSKPLLRVAKRREAETGQPIGFLASFTAIGRDCVFVLKRGINRVGVDPAFGDFDRLKDPAGVGPVGAVLEGRQWILVHHPGEVLVMDDRSTNQSVVLPRDCPRIEGVADPRFDEKPYYANMARIREPGTIALDWDGTVVQPLHEGDVLLGCYAALVFGVLPVDS